MLDKLFISVLNMSLIGSYVIVFVLIAKLLLKKAPKIFPYALWSVVLFRLICPFSFESVFSLIPMEKAPISQDIIYSQTPQINTGIAAFDSVINPILPVPNNVGDSVNPIQVLFFIGAVIWAIGVAIMAIYSVVSFIKLKQSLIGAVQFKDNTYLADHISSPFVMGLFKPKIYLPSSLSDNEKGFVIAHETCHIRRLDHITRILGFAALAVHWFNPLVWLAFIVSGKDMEMACDETVMKKMDTDVRGEYSQALLRFGTAKKMIHATPLAFGEGDTKNRIKNVLSYKKTAFWMLVICVVAVVAIGVGLTVNPISNAVINPSVQEYIPGQGNIVGNVDAESYKQISPDFEIGADKNGIAVFKDPYKAFETFEQLYADGIAYVQKTNDLPPLSKHKYELYKVYGSQITDGTEEQMSQAQFVSRFLDIYENSFKASPPNMQYVEPTQEEKADKSEALTHDQAVASALFSLSNNYAEGECITEGHIILGYDDSDKNKTKIYALTTTSKYGFENDNFVQVSGSAFPAVITLNSDNTVSIQQPMDGSGYAKSIEKMFPKKYHDKVFKYEDVDREQLKQLEEKYASEYLSKIGREAKIGAYSDFKYISLTDLGVSVEVSNNLQVFYKEHNYYPDFIGTRERLENGIRMVYEMSYHENQNEIKFTKFDYNTKKILEQFSADAKTGSFKSTLSQDLITKEIANEFVNQTLSTFKLSSDNTISFSLPQIIPTEEGVKTEVYISSSATFASKPGTSSVQEILDWKDGWKGGEIFTEKLDVSRGTLKRLFLRVAFMTSEGENSYREYAANYIEFFEPFKFDAPVSVTDKSVELSKTGTSEVLKYTMQTGEIFSVTLTLPKRVSLASSENYPQYASTSGGEMPTVVVLKDKTEIGTLTLFNFGTDDKEDLAQGNTAENTLPMQIYSPIALANHAQFDNYKVCKHSATGANATAEYLWQDLTGYDGRAPEAPWLKSDCVLAYDYEKAPFFVNLNLVAESLSASELENLAKSIIIMG